MVLVWKAPNLELIKIWGYPAKASAHHGARLLGSSSSLELREPSAGLVARAHGGELAHPGSNRR